MEIIVDGVTTLGFSTMAMNQPAFGAGTPAGIMRLLDHLGIGVEGKHAVVVEAGYHAGGVGPMTIATLMAQTVAAAEKRLGMKST